MTVERNKPEHSFTLKSVVSWLSAQLTNIV